MILEVSRGHIKVRIRDRSITVPGEMFFLPNNKMGFAVFESQIKFWDSPYEDKEVTKGEFEDVISEIRADFYKGGHILEVE